MSRDFTYDIATDIGVVRNFIPDKVEETAYFSDQEIQSFINRGLTTSPTYYIEYAVMYAWLSLAAESASTLGVFSGQKIKVHRFEIDNGSSSQDSSPTTWAKLAEQLRKSLQSIQEREQNSGYNDLMFGFFGGLSKTSNEDFANGSDNNSPIFDIGFFDNI